MADTAADQRFEHWCEYLQVAPERDLPSVAYHYTGASGILGILKNRSVYATDKHFLNDRTEIFHGIQTATKGLKAELDKADSRSSKELLRSTCEYIEAESAQRHFIFSMSERGDDLSQWRGYANEGKGFTIGFDANRLREMSVGNNAPFGFNRISYSSPQFRQLISRLASEYSDASNTDQEFDNTARCFSATVDVASCFYKHSSFRYEREWRLVSYVYHDSEEVLIRSTDGRLVPYIEIPLCRDTDPLPILEIGIGPAVQNPNTRLAIEDLCRNAKISPKIYNAATPFVRY